MKVRIKRFDKNYPLPNYKTVGAAGADVYARETVTIQPHSIAYIKVNFAIEIPEGYWLMLAPRSSAHKQKIMFANSFGVGDRDFCGDNDEYAVIALNFSDEVTTLEAGTRIGQILLMKHTPIEFDEVDHLGNKDRGGIGSTGDKN